ncbi:MAG TPA: molybdopterin oxidoreductase [Polyangiaceae bacterium]|nr:molybdopterin oxidoreductase [Polyangiaceae bacterium]
MSETPRFIQGVYAFRGAGLAELVPLQPAVTHKVPFDKRAQLIYLRAGNSSAEMVYLVLLKGKRPLRYFPIGAKGAVHVPLAIVEDIEPESVLELAVGAPQGLEGAVLVDLGLLEI